MTSSKGGYLSKFKGLGSPSKPDKLGSGFICSGPAHCISLFPLAPKQPNWFFCLSFFSFLVFTFDLFANLLYFLFLFFGIKQHQLQLIKNN